jgi:hypothetical protein
MKPAIQDPIPCPFPFSRSRKPTPRRPGVYRAIFEGVTETKHEQYGPGVVFNWKVQGGEHDGKLACRAGKPEATTGNITGKLLHQLLGEQFKPGEVDLTPCIGRAYTIVVALAPQGDGKKTRVESCVPAA